MNIFENYLKITKQIILRNSKELNIEKNFNYDGIIIEIPPVEYNFDLSTNIAMILAKKTKKNPKIIAEKIKSIEPRLVFPRGNEVMLKNVFDMLCDQPDINYDAVKNARLLTDPYQLDRSLPLWTQEVFETPPS